MPYIAHTNTPTLEPLSDPLAQPPKISLQLVLGAWLFLTQNSSARATDLETSLCTPFSGPFIKVLSQADPDQTRRRPAVFTLFLPNKCAFLPPLFVSCL